MSDEQGTDDRRWTAGRDTFGGFADGLADYTDTLLFDEVWERGDLSKRDRSLITVAALVATGKTEQLGFHLGFAVENGVTQQELIEAVTHLAFYTGWPNAMGAMAVAKKAFTEKD